MLPAFSSADLGVKAMVVKTVYIGANQGRNISLCVLGAALFFRAT